MKWKSDAKILQIMLNFFLLVDNHPLITQFFYVDFSQVGLRLNH